MKKIFVILFLLCLFYTRYSVVDMNRYVGEDKQIEVKGEVKSPGVFQVHREANVKTIIEKAGGALASADLSKINLSENIANQGVLVIPKKTEKKLISISTATVEELDTLKGIGPKVAQRIIDYRMKTPFRKVEDIMNVKGIKDALFQKIVDDICL